MGLKVLGVGFRVWCLGFRAEGLKYNPRTSSIKWTILNKFLGAELGSKD